MKIEFEECILVYVDFANLGGGMAFVGAGHLYDRPATITYVVVGNTGLYEMSREQKGELIDGFVDGALEQVDILGDAEASRWVREYILAGKLRCQFIGDRLNLPSCEPINYRVRHEINEGTP